jgi:type IV pilus assembly protein PilB
MSSYTIDPQSENGAAADEPHPGAPAATALPAGISPPRSAGRSAAALVEVLVELGFTSRARADSAIEEGHRSGHAPERVLRESDAVTADQLTRAVAERLGTDFVDLSIYKPDLTASNLVSLETAKRYEAVPVGFDESGRLLIAMANPANVIALDDLRLVTGTRCAPWPPPRTTWPR